MNQEYPGEWLTSPTQSIDDNSKTIFVTGRTDVDKFRLNPRYSIRVEISLPYGHTPSGLPDATTAELLGQITDNLVETFKRDTVAVLTGIYTGNNMRNWVFYTKNTHIFQGRFNQALAELPLLPISIIAENDPEWEEYAEMKSAIED